MNSFRNAFFMAVALGVGVGLPACQKEGPAERAGKKLNESAQKAGEKMKDMGEAVKEKAGK
jgi:hypothetical protein